MRSQKSIELPDGELAPGFALLHENGETQLVLGVNRGGAVITLRDNPNNARVVLFGGAEDGLLAFSDKAGETVWHADSGSSQGVASAPEDKNFLVFVLFVAPYQTLKPLSTQLTEIGIYFIPEETAAVFHCHLTLSS